VAIFDLDGVIADAAHRQHFLDAERSRNKDWKGFFHACTDDVVIPEGKALAEAMRVDVAVIVLTARIHETRDKTIDWLVKNEVRHDWLIMRGAHSGLPSSEWKRTELEALQGFGADIRIALDDDPRNIAMIRELGIPALYVHSGYYADRTLDVEFR
jgi:hypothetical protein